MSSTKNFDDYLKKLEEVIEKGNKKFKELLKLSEIATPSKTPAKKEKLKLINKKQRETEKQEKAIRKMFKEKEKIKKVIELFKERKKILKAIKEKIEKENKQ